MVNYHVFISHQPLIPVLFLSWLVWINWQMREGRQIHNRFSHLLGATIHVFFQPQSSICKVTFYFFFSKYGSQIYLWSYGSGNNFQIVLAIIRLRKDVIPRHRYGYDIVTTSCRHYEADACLLKRYGKKKIYYMFIAEIRSQMHVY